MHLGIEVLSCLFHGNSLGTVTNLGTNFKFRINGGKKKKSNCFTLRESPMSNSAGPLRDLLTPLSWARRGLLAPFGRSQTQLGSPFLRTPNLSGVASLSVPAPEQQACPWHPHFLQAQPREPPFRVAVSHLHLRQRPLLSRSGPRPLSHSPTPAFQSPRASDTASPGGPHPARRPCVCSVSSTAIAWPHSNPNLGVTQDSFLPPSEPFRTQTLQVLPF